MTLDQARSIIAELEQPYKGNPAQVMFSTGFSAYLASQKYNLLFNPEHTRVYQDMTQPFAHYFIASSHNTYGSLLVTLI